MNDPDKYYVMLGRILCEDALTANPRKAWFLKKVLKNDMALELMARKHEENVKASGDPELEFQLSVYEMRAKGRLNFEAQP
jgi:hypothetical protein